MTEIIRVIDFFAAAPPSPESIDRSDRVTLLFKCLAEEPSNFIQLWTSALVLSHFGHHGLGQSSRIEPGVAKPPGFRFAAEGGRVALAETLGRQWLRKHSK